MSALLEARGLTKRYGSLAAVTDISFDLAEGEILGLIGPNGAGKSTVVNLIAGSVKKWTGEIRFRGHPLRRLAPHQIGRLGIARTFQVAQPFCDMSLVENVMVGAMFARPGARRTAAARTKALDVLESLGLADKANRPAESLNASERKRLEIAKALAMEPQLVLLDEVMAGLNPVEVERAIELIGRVRAKGVSILMVEHVMHAISSLADRIIVLHHGEKVSEGPPTEVLRDEFVVGAYLGRRGTRPEQSTTEGM